MSEESPRIHTPFDRLVRAWLQHVRNESSQDFWAWEEVEERVGPAGNIEDGWLLVLELLEHALPEDITNIAAGPLESLVRAHRVAVVDRVVQRAGEDPKFRECLAGIWLSDGDLPPEELARLVWASGGRIKPLK